MLIFKRRQPLSPHLIPRFACYASSAIFRDSPTLDILTARNFVMKLSSLRTTLFRVSLLLLMISRVQAASPGTSGTGNGGVPPLFLTGTDANSSYPYYYQSPYNSVPVGKTLVLPIAVSGSGPITYSVSSNSPAFLPIIKTGYPVMNIHVTYSGTTAALTGTAPALTTLHAFTSGTDGANPFAGLVRGADGNYYGAAETGSNNSGTIFQVTTSGSFATIFQFTGGNDGANPYGNLVSGTDGLLYGTTETSGSNGFGTVFSITTSGSLTTLYSFSGGADGGNPYGGVVFGLDRNLYGTTSSGGSGAGTIFQISTSGSLATLHTFNSTVDGGTPKAALLTANNGSLYGTTVTGGSSGNGAIFNITTSGTFSVVHAFTGGSDGATPYAGLITGSDGNLYGTTETGGGGYGTVYKLSTSGSLTTIHAFQGGADGANPFAGVIQGASGYLYGTTATDGANGYGTIYQMTTSGSISTVHAFTGNDGANPYAGLVEGSEGFFYGTTKAGGSAGYGTAFQLVVPTVGSDAFSGNMKFALLRDMAPVTTGFIAGFAQAGYYNGLDFFRITNLGDSASGFIAQGGDPSETGTGTPGFSYNNEFSPSLIFTGAGQLAMANSGFDSSTYKGSNGSQFFITQGPIRSLDFGYTIFGQLLTGFDTMNKVMGVPLQSDGSSPVAKVEMDTVSVSPDNTDAILLVSSGAYAPGGGTLKVSARDQYGNPAMSITTGTFETPGLSIPISTPSVDTVNDPPFLVPVQNVTAVRGQKVELPVRAVDLEYDSLQTHASKLNQSNAEVSLVGNTATVSTSSLAPVAVADIGFDTSQVYTNTERSSQYDLTSVTVGLGEGKLTGLQGLYYGTPGTMLALGSGSAGAFGSFITSNPSETAADFSASINWGTALSRDRMERPLSRAVRSPRSSASPRRITLTHILASILST